MSSVSQGQRVPLERITDPRLDRFFQQVRSLSIGLRSDPVGPPAGGPGR